MAPALLHEVGVGGSAQALLLGSPNLEVGCWRETVQRGCSEMFAELVMEEHEEAVVLRDLWRSPAQPCTKLESHQH